MAMDSVHDQRAGAGEIQGCDDVSISLPADETFVEDTTSPITNRIKIKDWSQTGRGSHVDFGDKENFPMWRGRFLGRGATSDVYETTIQGYKIAHKRILFRRRIGRTDIKGVEILKRLSHVHIVQLVGTYAQGKCLGILLYPVAVCDLHTFFEDVEAWSRALIAEGHDSLMAGRNSLDSDVESRLKALHYDFPQDCTGGWASIVYSRIGCLVSAITYLHNQQIRHKDLKPSNILLSPDQLWLTDFGSSTDFSQLSQSATDNERGTPRYFAPEVAAWKQSGRAADMFSLGCVLLEILSVHRRGSLHILRVHRGVDPAFHANTSRLSTWLEMDDNGFTRREHYLEYAINLMLSTMPERRPKAYELLHGLSTYDLDQNESSVPSIFGHCCKRSLVPQSLHRKMLSDAEKNTQLIEELTRQLDKAKKIQVQERERREEAEKALFDALMKRIR